MSTIEKHRKTENYPWLKQETGRYTSYKYGIYLKGNKNITKLDSGDGYIKLLVFQKLEAYIIYDLTV